MTPATKAIVLVDDEKSYLELLTQMLADQLDCPVHAFTRPTEALSALPEIKPSVIVTDYYMPQVDGIEFIRRAAALAPQAAFVMITGHNLSAREDELAKLAPLKAFLEKPFSWRTLAEEIIRVWPAQVAAPASRRDVTWR